MCRSFCVVLLKILAIILQIHQGGAECSTAEKEVCELAGRLCSNNRCGSCFNRLVEVNNECYDPADAQEVLLKNLENCDPNVDPACKEKLESIRDQLTVGLADNFEGNELDLSLSELTEPTLSTANGDKGKYTGTRASIGGPTVKKLTKGDRQFLKKDHKLELNESNNMVDLNSKETQNGSKTNVLSKKSPVHDSGDDDDDDPEIPDVYFLIIIIACTLSGVAGIALSGYCWYKLHNSDEKLNKGDYIPGVKKPNGKSSPTKNGDRNLDYKAEMYHYVHTKKQIAAMEKAKSEHLGSGGISNDEEDEVEDYTVYECPGLAPTEDMKVVNPFFSDQEVTGSDEGRTQSNHSSPSTPARSNTSPSR